MMDSGTRNQDETPTRPTRRPYALPLENGLRRVRTNSVEHDALVAGGYVVIEQDDINTILRLARRSTDHHVTNGDLARYHRLETETWEQIAAELTGMGHAITGEQLRWAADRFRAQIMHETGRAVVSGRIR
jgi:hypothetical protein